MKSALTPKVETKQNGALAPRKQFAPFHTLQQEMNRLFDDFKMGFAFPHPTFEFLGDFHASIDMKDTDKDVVVTAELPGVEMKDINISMKDNMLVLTGEKKQEKEEKEKSYYRMERSYGSFYRALELPCEVDKEAIDAVYKDGVLTVTLPKNKEVLTNEKKITVKAG